MLRSLICHQLWILLMLTLSDMYNFNINISGEHLSQSANNVDLFMLNGYLRNVVYNLQHSDEYDDKVVLTISRSFV